MWSSNSETYHKYFLQNKSYCILVLLFVSLNINMIYNFLNINMIGNITPLDYDVYK
jgi:hypothetical protein